MTSRGFNDVTRDDVTVNKTRWKQRRRPIQTAAAAAGRPGESTGVIIIVRPSGLLAYFLEKNNFRPSAENDKNIRTRNLIVVVVVVVVAGEIRSSAAAGAITAYRHVVLASLRQSIKRHSHTFPF